MGARYSPGLRRLHWWMALLVALAYVFIEQRGLFERGTGERAAMMQAHYWMGLSVLLLVGWRLLLRRRDGVPPITPALPAWQAWPAKVLHVALYAFLLAMPVLGLLTAWTDGKTLLLPFTDIVVPALLAPDDVLGEQLEEPARQHRRGVLLGDRPARAGRALPPWRAPRRHPATDAVARTGAATAMA